MQRREESVQLLEVHRPVLLELVQQLPKNFQVGIPVAFQGLRLFLVLVHGRILTLCGNFFRRPFASVALLR